MTDTSAGRRPVKSRNSTLLQKAAQWLADKNVTPNQISKASMVFAGLSCLSFCFSGLLNAPLLFILAAIFIQLRLLANLIDGLVAVEGGMGTRDGLFWNEAPDRVSDTLILVGAGIAISVPSLGLLAAVSALMTAYVRVLSSSLVGKEDFSGPMAKQHRMAVMTGAALLGAFEAGYSGTSFALFLGLSIVTLGAGYTALQRAQTLLRHLSAH